MEHSLGQFCTAMCKAIVMHDFLMGHNIVQNLAQSLWIVVAVPYGICHKCANEAVIIVEFLIPLNIHVALQTPGHLVTSFSTLFAA